MASDAAQLPSRLASVNYGAYLYFRGNAPDVPWAIGDTSSMINPLPIELPTSILKLSTDLSANQTLLFVQSSTGSVSKSEMLEFGAYIT